jgi:hypothetical protein
MMFLVLVDAVLVSVMPSLRYAMLRKSRTRNEKDEAGTLMLALFLLGMMTHLSRFAERTHL